jgi:tetrahydromethanopterin S-methyltransferase subunit F
MKTTVNDTEPRRSLFGSAVYNFFALYLGVTPPAPGKEGFYVGVLLAALLVIIGAGYLLTRLLIGLMFG